MSNTKLVEQAKRLIPPVVVLRAMYEAKARGHWRITQEQLLNFLPPEHAHSQPVLSRVMGDMVKNNLLIKQGGYKGGLGFSLPEEGTFESRIIKFVIEQGFVSIPEVAQEFEIKADTAKKFLMALMQKGILHGNIKPKPLGSTFRMKT